MYRAQLTRLQRSMIVVAAGLALLTLTSVDMPAYLMSIDTRHKRSVPSHEGCVRRNDGSVRQSCQPCKGSVPLGLQDAQYNASLGCWHVRQDNRANHSRLHVAAEVNFQPGDRWEEVQQAINLTASSNPQVHYVLVTKSIAMLDMAQQSAVLTAVAHDIRFCPETLYGTPIKIGNLYPGTKVACSIDNWFPAWQWQCNFTSKGQRVVYVLQRKETTEHTGQDRSCELFVNIGSADGLMYEHIPMELTESLRFPRTFWGCENVAMWVLKHAGFKLVNLCPVFAPTHMHRVNWQVREPGRLRINHGENNWFQGERADLGLLCRKVHSIQV